jgi:hypothetical protein
MADVKQRKHTGYMGKGTGFTVDPNLYSNPSVSVPDSLTPDSVPQTTTGPRIYYIRAIKAYEQYLRTKYGRSDYFRVMLVSEAAKLSHLRNRLRVRGQEIGRFYSMAQNVRIDS